jgi:hypothetical protein
MSRGLGRIERAILAEIEKGRTPKGVGEPLGAHVSSGQLFFACYPEARPAGGWHWPEPTEAQRKAVWRAMHAIVRKFPQYALMGGKGQTPLWLYEPADPFSTLWAELAVKLGGFVPMMDAKALAEGREPSYALGHLRSHRSALRGARTVRRSVDGASAAALAAKARMLITANDPDDVRAGLREIAEALERLAP